MLTLLLLSLAIGVLLGLLGGGGSILTVPVLVYVAGLEPKAAIAASLVVVGCTSLTAMFSHARSGRVCWKTGLLFGLASMFGAYGGGRVAAFVPGGALLLLFAGLMLATAYAMLRGGRTGVHDAASADVPLCPLHLPLLPIVFDGLLVGAGTGLVGAGGGFLVVPALNLLGGLPMHAAVGTSLLVIAMKSAAALAGYASHVDMDWGLVGTVTAAAVVGGVVGERLSRRVSGGRLRRGFGMFVMMVALYVLWRELKAEMLADAVRLVFAHAEFFFGALSLLLLHSLYRMGNWVHGQRGGLR
jgi:uncharacterized membrane protein YfcA